MGELRYTVRSVEMYDVVDTLTGEIIYNTRDSDEATRTATEHEKIYNPQEESSGVQSADRRA